jgi:hypothetical protein
MSRANMAPEGLRACRRTDLAAMLRDDRRESPSTSMASDAISSPRSKRSASAPNVSTSPFTAPAAAPPRITVIETQEATVRFPRRPAPLEPDVVPFEPWLRELPARLYGGGRVCNERDGTEVAKVGQVRPGDSDSPRGAP